MTRFRFIAVALVALAALLVGAAIASGAASVKIINFSAKYNGTATVKVTGEVVDSIAAKGTGTGIPIGKGTITGLGKGEAKPQPCNNWGGTGVLKGTKGTITFKMLAGTQGCGDEEGKVFSIAGRATVTKATGKLAKAKGNLKVTGGFDHGEGTFAVKFTGKPSDASVPSVQASKEVADETIDGHSRGGARRDRSAGGAQTPGETPFPRRRSWARSSRRKPSRTQERVPHELLPAGDTGRVPGVRRPEQDPDGAHERGSQVRQDPRPGSARTSSWGTRARRTRSGRGSEPGRSRPTTRPARSRSRRPSGRSRAATGASSRFPS